MNTAISQYVSGLQCLIEIKKGSRRQIEKAILFFRTLGLDDVGCLEQGLLPPAERLSQLAKDTGMTEEECRNQLLAFLYWVRKNADLARGTAQPG